MLSAKLSRFFSTSVSTRGCPGHGLSHFFKGWLNMGDWRDSVVFHVRFVSQRKECWQTYSEQISQIALGGFVCFVLFSGEASICCCYLKLLVLPCFPKTIKIVSEPQIQETKVHCRQWFCLCCYRRTSCAVLASNPTHELIDWFVCSISKYLLSCAWSLEDILRKLSHPSWLSGFHWLFLGMWPGHSFWSS